MLPFCGCESPADIQPFYRQCCRPMMRTIRLNLSYHNFSFIYFFSVFMLDAMTHIEHAQFGFAGPFLPGTCASRLAVMFPGFYVPFAPSC